MCCKKKYQNFHKTYHLKKKETSILRDKKSKKITCGVQVVAFLHALPIIS